VNANFFFFCGAFPTRGSIGTLTKLQSRCPLGVPRSLRPRSRIDVNREEMHLCTECGAQSVWQRA
jgi:hypothetical protein